MNESSIIYCDESGNDGPNYLNPDQLFYVLAGWVVPGSAVVDASVEMERLRQARCPTAPELKFRMFRDKPHPICESMSRLGKIGLVPMYLVAEKRFCVAGKIIETFLDPYFNPAIGFPFTGDIPTKQELANTLYDRLSEASLDRFAEAYRNPSQADLEHALNDISTECQACVNLEMADLLAGSREKLAEIAKAEVDAVTSWGKGMGTLNLPCLISFLMMVEELGRQRHTYPKRIVHDEQGPYQQDYLKAFKLHRETDKDERVLINGMRVPYGALRHIDDFEFQRSVDQPLIQAADLLAGSIAHLSKSLVRGKDLTPQEIELGSLTLPALLLNEIVLAKPVCSDRMLRQFEHAIRLAFPAVASTMSDDTDGTGFRWTTSLPSGGPLPVLPPPQDKQTGERQPDISVRITLPIYGLANSEEELVLLLPPDVTYEQSRDDERSIPLWTRRELAESFLAEQEWADPHHVVEFGPKDVPNLVAQLREQSQWTDWVVFNLFDDDAAPYPINRLADDMERICERISRAVASGISDVLIENHEIDGQEVKSLLLSSGEYGAMRMSDGLLASGTTRNEAVEKLTALMTQS